MLPPTKSILLMLFAYFVGSIPFGYIIGLSYGNIDIREHGSGNVGMANVFRTLGPLPGLMTLFLDALKGFLIVFVSLRWIPPKDFGYNYFMWGIIICLIAFLTVIGHSYPVWLNFKGGKSVAVSLGILSALMSWWVAVPVAVFIVVVGISRYISLGSILAAVSIPVIFIVFHTFPYSGNLSDSIFIFFACVLAILVIVRHTSNIKRLLRGTESRFGIKVKRMPAEETLAFTPTNDEQSEPTDE